MGFKEAHPPVLRCDSDLGFRISSCAELHETFGRVDKCLRHFLLCMLGMLYTFSAGRLTFEPSTTPPATPRRSLRRWRGLSSAGTSGRSAAGRRYASGQRGMCTYIRGVFNDVRLYQGTRGGACAEDHVQRSEQRFDTVLRGDGVQKFKTPSEPVRTILTHLEARKYPWKPL